MANLYQCCDKHTHTPFDWLQLSSGQSFQWLLGEFISHPEVLCNIGYPTRTYLKHKFRKTSLMYNIRVNNAIVWTFRTEHGGITGVVCAEFQNAAITETYYGRPKFHEIWVKGECRGDILYCTVTVSHATPFGKDSNHTDLGLWATVLKILLEYLCRSCRKHRLTVLSKPPKMILFSRPKEFVVLLSKCMYIVSIFRARRCQVMTLHILRE